MQTNSHLAFPADSLPLLDEEFDKFDTIDTVDDHSAIHAHPSDDLGWEDQLDNGLEMSL